MQTYTVKAGDTLYGISNQFGVSAKELADLNNVNANTLRIGQVLKIPTNSGTNPSNMFIYTVKKGDSLYNIAKKYNTTVKDIIALNGLKNTNLSIGQQLRIPQEYSESMQIPAYINYVVKKGDSLYSIAKTYNTSVDTIMKDNGLTNTNLTIGQNLKIRTSGEGEVLECFGEAYTPPATSTPTTINYTVKKGDSLYKIANTYNTSVSDIVGLNNLNSNNLSIGQVLKIPTNNSPVTTTYVIKKGDSLYSIAKTYNTTVDALKLKNNLTTNNLSIGQILKI